MGYIYDALNRAGKGEPQSGQPAPGPTQGTAGQAPPPPTPNPAQTAAPLPQAQSPAASPPGNRPAPQSATALPTDTAPLGQPQSAQAAAKQAELANLHQRTVRDALSELDNVQEQVDALSEIAHPAAAENPPVSSCDLWPTAASLHDGETKDNGETQDTGAWQRSAPDSAAAETDEDLHIAELGGISEQSPPPHAPAARPVTGSTPAAAPTAPSQAQTSGVPGSPQGGETHWPFSLGPEAFDCKEKPHLDDRLVTGTNGNSIMGEEYRSIRTGILARWKQRRHLVHLITSAMPQEGKTITSLNLGLSFAELRLRRTLVVEADLRLPQFVELLGLPTIPGLIDVLEGKVEVEKVIRRLPEQGLYVLSAGGRAAGHAVQLLSNPEVVPLIQRLRQEFDHVIIDTPPAIQMADAGILGAVSDEVLMVVRLGQTPSPYVEQAIRTLNSYNASVTGLIGTDDHHYRQHYQYQYKYSYTRKSRHSAA